jgi:uncharacterized protein (DUF1684 family)
MRSVIRALILMSMACSKPEGAAAPAAADPKWAASLQRFRENRAKAIGGPDGWMTLVGRFGLKKGANTIGSDPKSAAVLPADRCPPRLGSLMLEDGKLFFSAAEGADVKVAGSAVTNVEVKDDSEGKPTVLEAGSLRLHVIRRGNVFMLRVKDHNHPALAAFKGLEWFQPDAAWRVRAKLEPSPPGTTVPIVNVLNQTEPMPSPGHLVFTLDGKEYRLTALKEDDPGLFVIFKDATAGHGTYPSGRFINTPAVDADGNVELDFNRAYSPPCAYTTFATCPLPPRENHLPVEVQAGEKYSGHHEE